MDMIEYLPHLNATLNGLATILLIVGALLIRAKREKAHKAVMLSALVTSGLFLVSYLTYHYFAGSKRFPTDTEVAPLVARYFYYFVLLTHVVLAAAVPFLAIGAAYLGIRDKRSAHKRLVRWAWPIWLYVSFTGIIVYIMLYQLYPPTN